MFASCRQLLKRLVLATVSISSLAVGMPRAVSAAPVSAAPAAAGPAAADREVRPARVLIMIGEDEYQTARTLPEFARKWLEPAGMQVTIVQADAKDPNYFPGLQQLPQADLLLLSVRRRTPTTEQLQLVRDHLAAGKPLVGIRTASHAFALRPNQAKSLPAGHAEWPDFDTEVLGTKYQGHYRGEVITDVAAYPHTEKEEILRGVTSVKFQSHGGLYRSTEMKPQTHLLLRGMTIDQGQPVSQPVAWTNKYGKSRVFYTSLGHPDDFKVESFNRILCNAVQWALGRGVSREKATADLQDKARDIYKADLAANEGVAELIQGFQGKGETGDHSPPTPAAEAAKEFQVRKGLEIELLAAEPDVVQPLFIDFDHRGRMWVVQYRQYPFPAGLKVVKYDQYLRAVFDKVPQPPPHHVPGADKITVYEDTDGDGRFDRHKDVITGLNIASSLVLGRGGLWVLNPPYLLFYPDANGDDVPDGDPEVHLAGFGLEDTHSIANSLHWGPDGWLYGANGSTTTGNVSSAASKNVAWKGQCIWRYHPETKVFEIYAEGGGNTFSLEIDAVGRVFSGTNNGHTRGMYYPQGSYGKKTWGKHGPLTNPYAFGFFEHMRHEGEQERFSQAFLIYEGGAFPAEYDHDVISANSLVNEVLDSDLLRDTSTWRTIDKSPMVLTSDRWFRPVCLTAGPDGSVYIADWYDTRLTHVDPRDNWHKTSGRVYRLKAAGTQPVKPFDLSKLGSRELVDLLRDKNKWFRREALRILGDRRDRSIVPVLVSLMEKETGQMALEALWAINLSGGFDDAVALRALAHANPHVRRWGVRLIGDAHTASPAVAAQLQQLSEKEGDLEVRAQLAASAKRLPAKVALPMVRKLLAHNEDKDDLHIPLLLWWALESKADSDRDAVLDLFDDPAFTKLPMVERDITWRISQRYAIAGDPASLEAAARLLRSSTSPAQSERMIRGLLEAFRGRKMANLPPALADALDEYQRRLGKSDVALGLRRGDRSAIETALKTVADERADRAKRLTYIEILGQIGNPAVVPTLLAVLKATPADSVQLATLQALANYGDPAIGKAVAGLVNRANDQHGVRSAAIRLLASRKTWAADLLNLVSKSQLAPAEVPIDAVQQLTLHHDPQVDAQVEKHWGRVRATTSAEAQKQIQRVETILRGGTGDPVHGLRLFTESCAKCHTLFSQGGKIGPDLTSYQRDNLRFLIPSIVDPSAGIKEDYTAFVIVTSDGRVLTGLIDQQDRRTVTLRNIDGQKTLIDRESIESLQATPTSLMPDSLLTKLDDQQIRDLFAYLTSRSAVIPKSK